MLRLLQIATIIAIALTLGSCDREKQDDTVLLEGTTWALKASIHTTNGDVDFVSTAKPIQISFLKGKRYIFSSNSKSILSSYKFSSEAGHAKFSKPLKPANFGHEANVYLAATLSSTSYEIAGNCLRIANPSSNDFLVFERIK